MSDGTANAERDRSKTRDAFRVVDLSTHLSGPFASTILGGLGAEVIKVERGPAGEPSRSNPPLFRPDRAENPTSITFESRNRGKKSIILDLKSAPGREAFLDLCAVSDVVIENFRPGILQRLGIPYEVMRRSNEQLCLCSISGFGATGPRRGWMAYDTVIQAYSGLMGHTGDATSGPLRTGVSLADTVTGLYGAIAVLAALHQRADAGRGVLIEVSMLEAVLSLIWDEPWAIHEQAGVPQRSGNAFPRACPWNSYPAGDGLIVVCVARDDQWRRLVDLMSRDDETGVSGLLRDREQQWRLDNRPLVDGLVATWTRKRRSGRAVEQLQEAGVPAAPVTTTADVTADPQITSRRSLVPLAGAYDDGADHHPVITWELPFLVDGKRSWSLDGMRAPAEGEHTQEVLARLLGYGSARIHAVMAAADEADA